MKSRAHFFWLIAVAAAIAVVPLFVPDARRPTAQSHLAWPVPTGIFSHPCFRGSTTGAPDFNGNEGNCYNCRPTESNPADDEPSGETSEGDSPPTLTPNKKGNPGASASDDGAAPEPAGNGTLDPETGAFVTALPLDTGSTRGRGFG